MGYGQRIVQSVSSGLHPAHGGLRGWPGARDSRERSGGICWRVQPGVIPLHRRGGRDLFGDSSPLWGVPVGVLLVWLGLDLMGVAKCRLPGKTLSGFTMRGYRGAFILGGSYGILSGACTFGFIAPILAIITVQQRVVEGIALILFFALGHCLPIVLAGSSVALSQRLVEAKGMRLATQWGRKLAGLLVIGIGLYFAVSPFIV